MAYGVPASECICTSTNWRDCDDKCDACWGQECHAADPERGVIGERTP
jgi:hypothetical protein